MSAVHLAHALRHVLKYPGNESVRKRAEAALADYDAGQAGLARNRKAQKERSSPLVIGEHRFASLHTGYMYAKTQGFDGTEATFLARHRKGLSWADMIKPVDQARIQAQRQSLERKRSEMQQVIATMDGRKANV